MGRKKTYEEVKGAFSKAGFTLLSKEYINNKQKLYFLCPNGHKHCIDWSGFQQGQRCGRCWGNIVLNIQRVREAFVAEGYTLLTDKIQGVKDKLQFICPSGHQYVIEWNKFQQGKRCGKCKRNGGYTQKEVEAVLAKDGYTLLGKYIHSKERVSAQCPRGHIFELLFNQFISRGDRCPTCFCLGQSKVENILFMEVCSSVSGCLQRTKEIISPYELDIYIPDKKLAIEFCGLYWHSEVSGKKRRDYHYNKMKMCLNFGIRLITVFEDEYRDRPEVVLSRILYAAGVSKNRVFARDTKVEVVSNCTAKSFLNKNHLQGCSRVKKAWGLFYRGSLLGVSTVSSLTRPHSSGGGRILELKRMAFIPGVSVVGGASKMFKHTVDYAKKEGYTGIRSYCDMRYGVSTLNVYDKLGFILTSETKYTPHYVDRNYTCRKRNQGLRKTPEERKTGKTEWELRRAQGYDRIWDCGHKAYTYFF